MKVYGYTIQTLEDGSEVPQVTVRVFGSMNDLEYALDFLELTDDQELSTFETEVE